MEPEGKSLKVSLVDRIKSSIPALKSIPTLEPR